MAQGGGGGVRKLAAIKQALAPVSPEVMLETEYAARGSLLDVKLAPEHVVTAVTLLDQQGFFIEAITGVDWLGEKMALRKEAAAAAAAKAKAAAAAGEEAPVAEPLPEAGPEEMEVVYDFNHYEEFCRVVLRTRVLRETPEVPTISSVFPGADWHERETHDFFGIRFVGHPYLVPLLLPEDADFHPLLKDYRP